MERATKTQPWRDAWPPAKASEPTNESKDRDDDDGGDDDGGDDATPNTMNGPTGYNDKNELIGNKNVEEAIKTHEAIGSEKAAKK